MVIWLRNNNWIVLFLLWVGLIYAVLQIHFQTNLSKYSVCGPWGCGPPSNTLLAIHAMWLVMLLPPAIYLQYRFRGIEIWMQRVAGSMVILGSVGVLTIIAWQWVVWLPQSGESFRPYIWQRCGFAVLTAIDWPLLQLILTGIYLLMTSRFEVTPEIPQSLGKVN